MADDVIHGKDAAVRIRTGASSYSTLKNTNEFTINVINNVAEIPVHRDNWLARVAGMRDWSGTITMNAKNVARPSPATAAVVAVTDSLVTVILNSGTMTVRFPISTATMPYFSGNVVVTGFDHSAPSTDAQSQTISFVGDGALVFTT